jgi:thiol-disulfide isomerase/thioredoxin
MNFISIFKQKTIKNSKNIYSMIDIFTEKDFNLYIKGKVLVYFYADWCGICQYMNLILKQLEEKINIIKIDADNCNFSERLKELEIITVPTFILYENEKIIKTECGSLSHKDLKKMIS